MRLGLLTLLALISLKLTAQDYPLVNGNFTATPLEEVLSEIGNQASVKFYFDDNWLDELTFTGSFTALRLDSALVRITANTPLEFYINLPNVYLTDGIKIVDKPPLLQSYEEQNQGDNIAPELLNGLMFSRDYQNSLSGGATSSIVEIGNRKNMSADGTATIAGYIKDAATEEPLEGVVVYVENPTVATVSDESGFYSLSIPNGRNSLIFQYLGMQSIRQGIILFSDGQLNVAMEVDVVALREVLIESARDANVSEVQMGVSRISIADTKNVPIALGERDIMKIATTTAGVQTVGEGSAGYNVRGGKSDQNLILLNDATIYNASHFFGFFSVFNSDAIEDMTVYKSAIPARFGGRLSSVFDIDAKKTELNKVTGSGGISPVTAKLTLNIPLAREKAGLMVAGRTTYSNWLLKQINNANFSENRVFFADVMLRYDHKINDKNDLLISGYYSNDKFRVASDTVFSYSDFAYENANASVRWTHQFSPNLEGVFIGAVSTYNYELFSEQSPPNAFNQDFGISDVSLEGNINYYSDGVHTMRTGLKLNNYRINPGTKTARGEESIVAEKLIDPEQGIEASAYISDEFIINPQLTLYAGLRLNFFANYGPQTVYTYQPGSPINPSSRIDSTQYGNNEIIKAYFGPEIRLNARYSLTEFQSIKASYGRTRQNIHTLSNSASISPPISGVYPAPTLSLR